MGHQGVNYCRCDCYCVAICSVGSPLRASLKPRTRSRGMKGGAPPHDSSAFQQTRLTVLLRPHQSPLPSVVVVGQRVAQATPELFPSRSRDNVWLPGATLSLAELNAS